MGIERLTPDYLSAILEIERASFSDPWSETAFAECFAEDSPWLTLGVVEEGELLGYICLHLIPFETHIANLAVGGDVRRMGVASVLAESALYVARERGDERVTLEVRASNTAATALYTKLGFCVDGVQKNGYEHPREDAVLMSYKL